MEMVVAQKLSNITQSFCSLLGIRDVLAALDRYEKTSQKNRKRTGRHSLQPLPSGVRIDCTLPCLLEQNI